MSNDPRRTKGGIVHPRVERVIKKIGADISHARRVRRIGAEDFARRVGISRATLHRLEQGDPGIALNTLAMALHAIGRLDALANIAEPADDHVTMMQMMEQAPKRINKSRAPLVSSPQHDNTLTDEVHTPASKFVGF